MDDLLSQESGESESSKQGSGESESSKQESKILYAMPVVTVFKLSLNVGAVSPAKGEAKAPRFAPLALALRGRGLHRHDSNSCKRSRKLRDGSKSGSTGCYISIVRLSETNRSKQTCVENISSGLGGNLLGEHDYWTTEG